PSGEGEMWGREGGPLGQAKPKGTGDKPLTGQIAAITGAGGAIGEAAAKAFADAGAEVALLDLDETATQAKAKAIGASALAVRCDVTSALSVRNALDQAVAAFSGVDI